VGFALNFLQLSLKN